MLEFGIFISIRILAGLLGSLLGLGGGLILTPILTIAMGYDIKVAVVVSIFAVLGTSTGSALAYLRVLYVLVLLVTGVQMFGRGMGG